MCICISGNATFVAHLSHRALELLIRVAGVVHTVEFVTIKVGFG